MCALCCHVRPVPMLPCPLCDARRPDWCRLRLGWRMGGLQVWISCTDRVYRTETSSLKMSSLCNARYARLGEHDCSSLQHACSCLPLLSPVRWVKFMAPREVAGARAMDSCAKSLILASAPICLQVFRNSKSAAMIFCYVLECWCSRALTHNANRRYAKDNLRNTNICGSGDNTRR
jgi:hypothetical protein